MCDPAREEEQGGGRGEVRRFGIPRPRTEVHADVVQGHQDDDDPSQQIDGLDSLFHISFKP